MRATLRYIAIPALMAVFAGCSDGTTVPLNCNGRVTASLYIASTPLLSGVITKLKFEPTQTTLHVLVQGAPSWDAIFVVADSTPVFAQTGGTVNAPSISASSACRLSVGDKVQVWGNPFGAGFGDYVPISESGDPVAPGPTASQIVVVR